MSTYSPSLRVELLNTGTNAGTWGNTTNDNFSTVFDVAIAGYITVTALAANQALTYVNGPTATASANESVRAALNLTTSTGADFAVYAPPVSKLYVVKNSSSYTATIYNSTVIGNTTAAGTGVAIPAGKTMAVWSDGTNFTQQTNHLISPTLASPTMTGTPVAPTAAYGTSTTQVASTAFVQAALQALHPVGSIYINATNSTNPATLFGFGTWVAFGAGRVLVGLDGTNTLFDTAEETGGSYDAITVSHTHTASSSSSATSTFTGSSATTSSSGQHYHGTGSYGNNNGIWFYGIYSQSGPGGQGTFWNGSGGGGAGGQSEPTNGNTVTSYAINASGGDAHTHSVTASGTVATTVTTTTTVDSTGSSGTNANIQPYITVYMWKRTA